MSELQVVLPRHSFPTIHYPGFIDVGSAMSHFTPNEPAIVVEVNGNAKAYPLGMLTMHEIVNDTIGGMKILPTFCPLCNSSIVYNREVVINGSPLQLEFEVSGMLRNSDMVMYDTKTETLWQQLTGTGIVGEYMDILLEVVPSLVISIREFRDRYPNGQVLSPLNGSRAEGRYGTNPYAGYDDPSGKPYERFFSHTELSTILDPMERVLDLEVSGARRVYPFSILKQHVVVNDTVGGTPVLLMFSDSTLSVLDNQSIKDSRAVGSVVAFSPIIDGIARHFEWLQGAFRDTETRSVWSITGLCMSGEMLGTQLEILPHRNHFAFAVLAFYPNVEVYRD